MAHITIPNVVGFESFSILPQSRVALDESPFSFKQQTIKYPGQRWLVTASTPLLNRASIDPWRAFIAQANGTENTFSLGDPLSTSAKGSLGGSPVVDGGSQTGSTLDVRGCSANITGWALSGDYFSIGGSQNSRLYMITEDADTDGSGNVTLSIWPDVQNEPSDGSALTFSSPTGAFRLITGGAVPINTNNQSFTRVEFTATSVV